MEEATIYMYEFILEFNREVLPGRSIMQLLLCATSDTEARTELVNFHLARLNIEVGEFDYVKIEVARTELSRFAGDYVYDTDELLVIASEVVPKIMLPLSSII